VNNKLKDPAAQERVAVHAGIIAAAMLSGNSDIAHAASKYGQEQNRIARASVAIARNIELLSQGVEPEDRGF
jgi:hypothetical protein